MLLMTVIDLSCQRFLLSSWQTHSIGKVTYLQAHVLGKLGYVFNGLILLKEKLSEDLVIADTALNKNLTLGIVVSLKSFPICQTSEEEQRL